MITAEKITQPVVTHIRVNIPIADVQNLLSHLSSLIVKDNLNIVGPAEHLRDAIHKIWMAEQ